MSDYQQKNNEGVLFKNKDKQQDTHADYNGHIMVNGVEYWINAWVNESKAGQKYMKVSVKGKQAVHEAGVANTQAAINPTQPDDFEDQEIPF